MSKVIKSSAKAPKAIKKGRYRISSDGFWATEYANTLFGAYIHYWGMRALSFGAYDVEIVDRAISS